MKLVKLIILKMLRVAYTTRRRELEGTLVPSQGKAAQKQDLGKNII
jgi:hypothetical protein